MTLNISSFFKMVMVTDFPLSVTLTFNASQATSGAQQAAQVFTELANKMQTMGQGIGSLNTSFGTINQSTSQASQSVGTFSGALTSMNQSANQVKTSIDADKASFTAAKTSIDQTKTSVDTVKTSLDQTNTSLDATKTAFDTTNTSLETTNTSLQSVTTAIQTQDPELVDLTTKMTEYTTAGTEAVTAMQNELTAMEQLNPAVKDITGTLGETNTVTKDLTPSLDAMVNSVKSSGPPLANLNSELVEHNTQSAAATTSTSNWGTQLSTTVLGATSLATSVFNLFKNIRDYNDGAIRVEATEKRVLTTRESLDKATRKVNALIAEGITSGAKYNQAILDQTEAQKGYNVALLKNVEAQQSFSDTQVGILFNSITTITGILATAIGAIGNYGKAWNVVKTILLGMGVFEATAAGITKMNTAAASGEGAFSAMAKGAEGAKLSLVGLATQAVATAAIIYSLFELVKALPDIAEQIKQYQTSQDPKNSLLTQTEANLARKRASLEQLGSTDPFAFAGARIGAGLNDLINKGAKFGTTETELKTQIKDYEDLKAGILEVAKARGINANQVTLEMVQALNLSKNIKVVGTDNKTLNDIQKQSTNDTALYTEAMAQWGAQAKLTVAPILEMEPALKGQMDAIIAVNDPLNKNNTLMGIQASAVANVTTALGDHTTGLKSVTDQSKSIVDAITKQNTAYQEEEQNLLLLANSEGELNDVNSEFSQSLIDMAVSQEDNTTAMKEAIASHLDYTKALTDTETHAKLVAEGHLAGALALKDYFNEIVSGTAQQETFNAGIKAFVESIGGLPPGIKETAENMDLWIKAVTGSEEALASLDKQIQDNVIKSFGEMQKAFEADVQTWKQGGDAADELKDKLKDLIPKDIREPIILNMEVSASEQSIKESIDLMERHLFTVIQTGAGKTQYAYQANVEATVNEDTGAKMLEKLKSNISDNLDTKGGDISSVTADKMTAIIDKGITAIHANPQNASNIVLGIFSELDTIKGKLGTQFGILTDDAVKAMGVPKGAIEAAKAAMAEVGTMGSEAYGAALVAQLEKQGADPQVIENVKKSFANVPAEGTAAGNTTATVFNEAFLSAINVNQGMIDAFQIGSESIIQMTGITVETMVKAWTLLVEDMALVNDQIIAAFEVGNTSLIEQTGIVIETMVKAWDLLVQDIVLVNDQIITAFETSNGSLIEQTGIVITTMIEAWNLLVEDIIEINAQIIEAFETSNGSLIEQTGITIEAMVESYALLLESIIDVNAQIIEAFETSNTSLLDQTTITITAMVEAYALLVEGIQEDLDAIGKAFEDGAEAWRTTIETVVEDMLTEFESMTDQVSQVIDDISGVFEDGAEEWLTTVEDVVESIISEFETIPDQVSQVVDDINSEIDKITKEVTIKVKYDTSGKPSGAAFGTDFVTTRGQAQVLVVGEGATRERVRVSREGEPGFYGGGEGGGGGGGSMIVNDTINVYTSAGEFLGSARTRRIFKNLESH
jgi:uncharacterized protein YeaO (DUF488 family)